MTPTVIISLCSLAVAACGVLISFRVFKGNQKKDTEETGESRGVMASDLGYIKAGIDDLKQEHREERARIDRLGERVTRCEESCKQAHHRINEVHEELQGLK